ncbi:hypothetical protein [Streptomyces sp. NPDC088400]|uniref:hypothetical protein n=1 Tax=Streptomyces sp. NPDC088400 TaxID=3365861 RepID=UPI003814FAD2
MTGRERAAVTGRELTAEAQDAGLNRPSRSVGTRGPLHIDLLAPVTLNQVLLHIGDADHTRQVVDTLNDNSACWVTPTTWTGHPAVRISVSNWQSGRESAEATAAAFLRAHREHLSGAER